MAIDFSKTGTSEMIYEQHHYKLFEFDTPSKEEQVWVGQIVKQKRIGLYVKMAMYFLLGIVIFLGIFVHDGETILIVINIVGSLLLFYIAIQFYIKDTKMPKTDSTFRVIELSPATLSIEESGQFFQLDNHWIEVPSHWKKLLKKNDFKSTTWRIAITELPNNGLRRYITSHGGFYELETAYLLLGNDTLSLTKEYQSNYKIQELTYKVALYGSILLSMTLLVIISTIFGNRLFTAPHNPFGESKKIAPITVDGIQQLEPGVYQTTLNQVRQFAKSFTISPSPHNHTYENAKRAYLVDKNMMNKRHIQQLLHNWQSTRALTHNALEKLSKSGTGGMLFWSEKTQNKILYDTCSFRISDKECQVYYGAQSINVSGVLQKFSDGTWVIIEDEQANAAYQNYYVNIASQIVTWLSLLMILYTFYQTFKHSIRLWRDKKELEFSYKNMNFFE